MRTRDLDAAYRQIRWEVEAHAAQHDARAEGVLGSAGGRHRAGPTGLDRRTDRSRSPREQGKVLPMQGSSDFTYKLYFLFFGVPLAALGIGFAFGLIAWRIRHRKAFPFLCVVLAFVLGYLFLLNEPTMIQPAIIAFLIGGALAIRRASHQQEREKEARATRLPR